MEIERILSLSLLRRKNIYNINIDACVHLYELFLTFDKVSCFTQYVG